MLTGKMMITDLDGTLFRSNHTFSKTDIQTLEDLKDAGVVRVLATGRSIFSIKRSITQKLPVDYLIFSTGAGIACYPEPLENILKSNSLSIDETKYIVAFLESLGVDYMIQNVIPDNHIFSYRHRSNNNIDFQTRLAFYKGYSSALDFSNIRKSSQLLVIAPENKGNDIFEQIKEELHQFSVIKATSPFDGKTMWIEIFCRGTSKSNAVSWLSNHLGISRTNTIAIGNDYNDEDLLSWVDKGFVVNNAPSDLKNRFHTVASNNNCGVTEAIKTGFGI
jgi:Cof subfamily protein (haloacid dehalogenase superfamily)